MKHFAGRIVVNNGSNRNLDFKICAVSPMAITAFAVTPAAGFECVVVSKFEERIYVRIGD
jgi:ribulose 1,5-bisphosphate synthetase/thiazole synthase